MVEAGRNIDVLVDVERLREALGEDVNDIVIRISAVVEIGAKGRLPFLSLQDSSGVRSVVDKRLEVSSRTPWILGRGLKLMSASL